MSTITFSPDGKVAAVGNTTIVLWNLSTKTRLPAAPNFGPEPATVTSMVFSPDNKRLAIASCGAFDAQDVGAARCKKSSIWLWDMVGNPQSIASSINPVTSLAFSTDSKLLAWGTTDESGSRSGNGFIAWVNPDNPALPLTPSPTPLRTERNLSVSSLAFIPDSRLLASGANDNSINLWSLISSEQHGSFSPTSQAGVVTYLAFWPGEAGAILGKDAVGHLLAIGNSNKTIALWSVTNEQQFNERQFGDALEGYQNEVKSLAFSPVAQTLATADGKDDVLLWNLNLDSWKTQACQIAGRNPTCAEQEQYNLPGEIPALACRCPADLDSSDWI